VRCDCRLDQDLWPVEADPKQIRQAFQNLLLHVVQALPEGGLVKIRAVNRPLGPENQWSLPPGKYVEVAIQHQGPGIPPESLGKIFDPHFSTQQTGSGLGLAASYAVIKNHHGQTTVESKVGHGTVLHIYLPATDRTVLPQEAKRPRYCAGQGKILVMDDEAAVREVLGKMLTILGYEAIFARDGREAIEKFLKARSRGEKIAAVILDLTVPAGMGGKEAIAQLRQIDPQVKSIVSSGYSDDPVMTGFSKYGLGGVIAKPYKVSDLSKLLHNLLSGETEAGEDD